MITWLCILFFVLMVSFFSLHVEYEPCPAWRTWPEVFGASTESGAYYTAMFMYTAVGVSAPIQ